MTELEGKTILVVDDDPTLLKLVKHSFHGSNSKILTAGNGLEGLHLFYTETPDLVILDIMMPGTNGREVCQHIRKVSNVPIIMLTALGQDEDIIQALDQGADDYVTKPFNPHVLVARARAALRRVAEPVVDESPSIYQDENLVIDLNQRRVTANGEPIKLSVKEYKLLSYLFTNAGQVLTFRQILEQVWGWEYQDNIDYVHVYISHIRRKLEKDPKHPKYLITEHGVGYRFEKMEGSQKNNNLPPSALITQALM
ncbi:MAG: response regulator transcription factor [Chloroflexota bacterium]